MFLTYVGTKTIPGRTSRRTTRFNSKALLKIVAAIRSGVISELTKWLHRVYTNLLAKMGSIKAGGIAPPHSISLLGQALRTFIHIDLGLFAPISFTLLPISIRNMPASMHADLTAS